MTLSKSKKQRRRVSKNRDSPGQQDLSLLEEEKHPEALSRESFLQAQVDVREQQDYSWDFQFPVPLLFRGTLHKMTHRSPELIGVFHKLRALHKGPVSLQRTGSTPRVVPAPLEPAVMLFRLMLLFLSPSPLPSRVRP
ncbi:hypothetical protein J6590_025038 [Homalodisca vitripennis]|nr:hypothetical protein J6590_025038 [Homalodisca vitripennis]